MDVTTNKPVAYSKTGANGYYSFSNIPNGEYKVYGELLNRASIPSNIIINATQNNVTGKNFVYNSNVIQPTNLVLSLTESEANQNAISLTPNPAIENFKLLNISTSSTVTIFDMIGKQIITFELNPNEQKSIDCSQWPKGLYLIESKSGKQKSTQKLLVK